MPLFDGSEVIIGKGAQADVYKYRGYAPEILEQYMKDISSDIEGISEEDLNDAITVCAILREREKNE